MTACESTPTNAGIVPDTAILRISIGQYPPDQSALIEEKLQTVFKEKVRPAVQALPGNISYYVTMDKEKHYISNVSLWTSKEAAAQMGDMQEMKEMGKVFAAMGVEFTEITNHELIWQLPEGNE